MVKRDIAVLDPKRQKLVKLDRKKFAAIDKGPTGAEQCIDLPRLSPIVDVTVPGAAESQTIATVHLWRLGLKYNVDRLLGNNKQLYILRE
ncbi:uncharacterized protein F4812DRAFT_468180 [Daldinia caldariorum]|uniref:uncharacterized protein n=1 Tax=Daldinia caldariorum TaxID=326644 RepID=UPI0020077F45|nr:uncharacterized protein F4812DRAFT_468180 [Daldinia caldariorum]KAI1464014.1 hypothetical protein F4812DRAFT_468180 [Daldinia caldariorum]